MSSSTRSKSASPSSPRTGSATDAADGSPIPVPPDDEPGADAPAVEATDDDDAERADDVATPKGTVEIELEVSRQRSLLWTVCGTAIGILLITQLGTVGVWFGFLLIGISALHLINLIQTLLYPPGTIVVTERSVTLPRGLCKPRPIEVKPADVTAAYFLRRSVPWNRSSPVLIVELGPRAMVFPRDWFASEADQRHVIHALLRGRPKTRAATAA